MQMKLNEKRVAQILIRVPDSLKDILGTEAVADERSLSDICQSKLAMPPPQVFRVLVEKGFFYGTAPNPCPVRLDLIDQEKMRMECPHMVPWPTRAGKPPAPKEIKVEVALQEGTWEYLIAGCNLCGCSYWALRRVLVEALNKTLAKLLAIPVEPFNRSMKFANQALAAALKKGAYIREVKHADGAVSYDGSYGGKRLQVEPNTAEEVPAALCKLILRLMEGGS